MVHYHYYIEAGAVIDASSRFYRVAIGSSKQGDRDYLSLTSIAVERGHYFELVSESSTDFVSNIANSLHPDAGDSALMFLNFVEIKARDLVKLLKGTSTRPISFHLSHSQADAVSYLNANYRAYRNIAKR